MHRLRSRVQLDFGREEDCARGSTLMPAPCRHPASFPVDYLARGGSSRDICSDMDPCFRRVIARCGSRRIHRGLWNPIEPCNLVSVCRGRYVWGATRLNTSEQSKYLFGGMIAGCFERTLQL